MRRLPWRIFVEWMQYAQLEPFGELRADLRAGQIAATMAQLWIGEKARRITPATFFPELQPYYDRQRDEEPSPDVIYKRLLMLTVAMGGEVNDKRKVDGD